MRKIFKTGFFWQFVGGFAIGSSQWKQVYNHVYWKCRNS